MRNQQGAAELLIATTGAHQTFFGLLNEAAYRNIFCVFYGTCFWYNSRGEVLTVTAHVPVIAVWYLAPVWRLKVNDIFGWVGGVFLPFHCASLDAHWDHGG